MSQSGTLFEMNEAQIYNILVKLVIFSDFRDSKSDFALSGAKD